MKFDSVEYVPFKALEIRNMLREIAKIYNLDLYFVDQPKRGEIKVVFVDRYDKYHHIGIKLDEVTDVHKTYETLLDYFRNHDGYPLTDKLVIDDRDRSSVYPNMMRNYVLPNMDVASFYPTEKTLEYCMRDVEETKSLMKRALNYQYGYKPTTSHYFKIEKVIFNDPATIVFWADGSKTVVKCQEGDTFDKEKGLAMAISKRALGDKGRYFEEFKKWIPEEKKEVFNPYSDAAKAFLKLGEELKKFNK